MSVVSFLGRPGRNNVVCVSLGDQFIKCLATVLVYTFANCMLFFSRNIKLDVKHVFDLLIH